MKKNKIIIKINIILLLVLVLPLKIEAKKSYNFIKINGEDLNIETYINENVVQNEKIVICSYRCSEDNKEYCNNEKFSAIYYNHDNTNISGNWFIDANLSLKYIDENVMGTGAQVKTRNNYSFMWEEFGNTTPYSGIYFGQSSTNNKNESWKNVTEYKNLQNSFICPKYMYFDHSITDVYGKDNNMELCYANEKEQCKTRNEENKTIFGKANDLEYSFNKELNEVLDNVIVSIQGELPEDILNKFLLANPGYECSSLFEDYDSISLVNEIYDSEIIDYYNSKIQASVPSDSINRSFYNYENLNKLFEAKKSKNPSLNIQYNNMDLVRKNRIKY